MRHFVFTLPFLPRLLEENSEYTPCLSPIAL